MEKNMKKVAVIGAGRIGKRHLDYYIRNKDKYNLRVYFSKTSQEGVDSIIAPMAQQDMKLHAEGFADWKEMLEIKPYIVDICSPEAYHLEHLKYVVDNYEKYGTKVISCQKPLLLPPHIPEGEKIVEKMDEKKIIGATALQCCSIPKQLENEKINGQIYSDIEKRYYTVINWLTVPTNPDGNPVTDLIPHALCTYGKEVKSIKKINEEGKRVTFLVNGQDKIIVGYIKGANSRSWSKGPYLFEYNVKDGKAGVKCSRGREFLKFIDIKDPLEVYLESLINETPFASMKFGLYNAKKTAEFAAC